MKNEGQDVTEQPQQEQQQQEQQPQQPQKSGSPIFAVLGWIFNAVAILFVPIFFGGVGIIFGYLHRSRKNKTHGTVIMIAGALCIMMGTLLGFIVGAMIY